MATSVPSLDGLSPEKRALFESLMRKKRAARASSAPAEIPWENPEWFESTAADLEARIEGLGLSTAAPVARLHSSQDSCVLHVALPTGSLYYKAVPPYFTQEVTLMRRLAADFPRHTPEILDHGENWYLMASMPGRPLSEAVKLDTWRRALGDFARLQMAYVDCPEVLFEAGFRDRRLDRFLDRVDGLLARRDEVRFTGLTFFADLERLKPAILAAARRLAAFAIPQTVEHGDFHPSNIYVDEAASKPGAPAPTTFFDFSDGSVSHPFFSPWVLLGFLEHSHPELLSEADALREAYLEPWRRLVDPARLVDAFDAARPLAKLAYLLNVGECIAHRPRSAPEESVDMRQTMQLSFQAVHAELSARREETAR
ncbi:MAG: aminoglycoside phosphotransferase family protein [Acidobacteriota bacterium]